MLRKPSEIERVDAQSRVPDPGRDSPMMLITWGLITTAPSALPLTVDFTMYYETLISSSILSKEKQEEKPI